MTSGYQRLAEFAHGLSYGDCSDTVIRAAKRILLDSIGCMVGGSTTLTFGSETAPSKVESYSVFGVGSGFSRDLAVIANGTSIVATEMDEGNQFAKGHPTAHFLAALFATVQENKVSGKEFLATMVAAYEVSARFGSIVSLQKNVHPHGNWGTASAAVAVAKLRGLNPESMLEAMLLAGSLPIASVWTSAFRGANVRNAYIGVSNLIGLLALDMVSIGVRSHPDVLQTIYDSVLGKEYLAELVSDGLGDEYLIEKNYMKIYGCCRFVHGAIDALTALMDELGSEFEPNTVQHIQVATYSLASILDDCNPPNGFAAKFSIPTSLAILLCKRSAKHSLFNDQVIRERDIQGLAERVAVVEDTKLTTLLPDVRATRVTMELSDGRVLVKEIHAATGDHTNPLTDEQIVDKFYDLAEPVIGRERCAGIMKAVEQMEDVEDCNHLIQLCVME